MSSSLTTYNNLLRKKSPTFPVGRFCCSRSCYLMWCIFCFQTFLQVDQGQRKEDWCCLLIAGTSVAAVDELVGRRHSLCSLVVVIGQPGQLFNWLCVVPYIWYLLNCSCFKKFCVFLAYITCIVACSVKSTEDCFKLL